MPFLRATIFVTILLVTLLDFGTQPCDASHDVVKRAHTSTISKAGKKELEDIDDLIRRLDFDSATLVNRRSAYVRIRGQRTGEEYRVDNEGPTANRHALLRLQSGSKTFAAVTIQPNVNFGRVAIQNAFRQSISSRQTAHLP